MAKKLEELNVVDNATLIISGKVAFSALKNPQKRTNTNWPEPKPTYKISVTIDPNDTNAFVPGTQDSASFAEFFKERVYQDKNGNYVVPLKTAAFTNKTDPTTGELSKITAPLLYSSAHNPASAKPTDVLLQNELAQGQDIKVMVRALPQRTAGMNRTYVIDAVQVPDIRYVKYFSGGAPKLSIAGFNTQADASKPDIPTPSAAQSTPVQSAPQPNAAPVQETPAPNPFAANTQQPAAQPDNQNNAGNPFTSNVDTSDNSNSPF